MLKSLFALFSTPAVSLQAARELNATAQAALTKVGEMFAAAGLDLEKMLEAGPDSLKAHLASLDQTADLKAAQEAMATKVTELATATESLAAEARAHEVTKAALSAHAELLKTVGFDAQADKPDDFPAKFRAHVEHAAALTLAKDGRPPVQQLSKEEIEAGKKAAEAVQNKTANLAHHYEQLAKQPVEQQRDYFLKHIKPLQG